MLPKNLKYGNRVESAPSKSNRVNIQPMNGSGIYLPGDTITVNISTRSNLVLATTESYFKFTVNYKSSADNNALRLDSCGAHGLISKMRVWHGSNLLQDISEYGLLAKMLMDIQYSTDSTYGKMNITSGTRSDLQTTVVGTGAALTAATSYYYTTSQINSGELISSSLANGATVSFTYALNLISILGSLCSQQYFPLFACTSAPIRLELVLQDSANKAYVQALDSSSFTLTNCEYVANFIELSDIAMGMIMQSLNGAPLQFVVPDYRNYPGACPLTNATASQYSFAIPAKFSSLKSLFVMCRPKISIATFFPYSCNVHGITDYFFRVGPQIMPSKAPNSIQEQFCEVLKAIGSISDLNHQPSIEKTSYSLNTSTAVTASNINIVNSGSFYIGLDLESYSNADKSAIFSGYNSCTDDIYCVINYGSGVPETATPRLDAFALFDCVVVFENNTAYVRY
jgi:hypothetical protein